VTSSFGFLNAFKPPGPSSAAYGGWVRRSLGGLRVGHWGTLDPTAAGVLPLAIGAATRLLPLLGEGRKQYVFELVVGERTDTGDASGRVIARATVPDGWRRELPAVCRSLTGVVEQVTPLYSAVKIGGRPLYEQARAGREVERPRRRVVIDELRVINRDDVPDNAAPGRESPAAHTARLVLTCSAGTYVRSLCEDVGRRLGLPARMGMLVRTAAGPFRLQESILPSQLARDPRAYLIDPLCVLSQPRVALDAVRQRRFAAGNEVRLESGVPVSPDAGRDDILVTDGRRLLGTGCLIRRAGVILLAPTRVLADS
jgi:tRNA pseudouridine55 synthase